ncbi:hypothetical protein V8F06_014295, partial [Rhypophila decipiens]
RLFYAPSINLRFTFELFASTMAIHPPKQRAQQSPDYYQKRRQRHAEDGTPKRNHAPKTKENMSVVTNRWKRYVTLNLRILTDYLPTAVFVTF